MLRALALDNTTTMLVHIYDKIWLDAHQGHILK